MLKNIFFVLFTLMAVATAPAVLAAEQPGVEAVTVQPLPATPAAAEATRQPTTTTQAIRDNHIDYRHCLELKSNREIAECRYKKK